MVNVFKEPIILTKEQEACVDYKGIKAPNLTVKGVAGSGKSLVIMAKARKFLSEYAVKKQNKVIIFTYNNTLAATIKEFLDANGEKGDYIKICTLDSYLMEVFSKIPGHPHLNIAYDAVRKSCLKKALETHKKSCGPHRFHDLDEKFWLEEITWMKDMDISDEDFDKYLVLPRRGRGGVVRMSQEDRKVAFQIFREYNAELKKKHCCEWGDLHLFISHNTKKIPDSLKFDHVLIDEAQDLSLTKMRAAVALHKTDMIIAMDANQRIFNQHWPMKELGISMTTKKLSLSFRCTKQIDALAESLRAHNDNILEEEDKGEHSIPEYVGEQPVIVQLDNSAAEQQFVTGLAKQWMKDNPKITVGILATKNSQCELISLWLAKAGVKHEMINPETAKAKNYSMLKPGVKVSTIYSAKGLEFVRVIIPEFVEGKLPGKISNDDPELAQEQLVKARNLAYVGMTRAMKSLVITYSGCKSSFIDEMDPSLYIMQKTSGKTETNFSSEEVGEDSLKGFFEGKGLEVIDKRPSGGCLWVVGDENKIGAIVNEAKKKFHAGGNFGSGRTTGGRRGWFTQCKK